MGRFIKFDSVSYEQTLAFGTNQENRAYNHAHLEKIKRQIRKSFDTMPPITINTVTNHIVDGQHRLKAYQNFKITQLHDSIKTSYCKTNNIPLE